MPTGTIYASTPNKAYSEQLSYGYCRLAETFLKHFYTMVGPKFLLSDIFECKFTW